MRVGLVGLGAMGRGVAASLLRAGHECVVFDTSPDAAFSDEVKNVVPGLAAQAYEEMTTQKPMRRIDFAAVAYDGPAERKLE